MNRFPKIAESTRSQCARPSLRQMTLVVLASVLTLSSCSTVKVKTDTGRLTRAGIDSANLLAKVVEVPLSAVGQFAGSGADLLARARKSEAMGRHHDAAADYLKAAADSQVLIAAGSEPRGSEAEKALVNVHNTALARFAELWIKDPRRLDPGPYHLVSGTEKLEIDLSPRSTYHRGYFDRFVPAGAIEEKGMARKFRDGYGAPLVAIREKTPERADEMEFFPPRGMYTSVTVTMDQVKKSDGVTHIRFSLRNPLVEESVTVGKRSLPLAADYSAPIAVILKGRVEALEGLRGFFKAEERIAASGIYLTEPYDPDRIPVLLIHGLISVPMIWRDVVPDMVSDPEISRRYQFMTFTYPSSYPLVESAALLREELAAIRAKYDPDGNDPLSRNLVVAGHSMGGMLTHTLVADIGDNLWEQFSDKPFEEAPFSADEREKIRKLVFFEPDSAVHRVVYFSAPHRGANMATKDIAGMLAKMAKLPTDVLKFNAELIDPRNGGYFKIPLDRQYTSRESLEPGAPMVAAMDASPYKKGVVYHSVMGDRGKGDTPNSSDGVVEYWSSHQAGAASELIVPTDHGSYKHPDAIADFRRILRLHAGI